MNQRTEAGRIYRYIIDETVNPARGRAERYLEAGEPIKLVEETLNLAFRTLNGFIHRYKESPDFVNYETDIMFWLEHLDNFQMRVFKLKCREATA